MLSNRIVPLIVAVALFMENMDSTVIATSLPAIAADIGTDPLALKLAITSYLISLAVFLPVSGWTADRFGARTVFRLAILVFISGSIGCALSNSLTQFVIARMVEGAGGAMMTPVARLILVRTVDKRELVVAMIWVTIPALLGPLIGPVFGGFLTTYVSWHWIFIINVPMGLAGIVLATIYIDDIKAETPDPFDARGAILAGVGIAGLTFGGSIARRSNFLPIGIVIAMIVIGAAAAVAYVMHARRTPAPILDLSLLRFPTLRAAVVGGSIYRAGVGCMPFLLPLFLQLGFGLTAFQSGLITVANVFGALGMKTMIPIVLAHVRIPLGAGGERDRQLHDGRPLRDLHAGHVVRLDRCDLAGRRLLPLAAIYEPQHHRLCRHRFPLHEPRHLAGRGCAATVIVGRCRARRVAGGADARLARRGEDHRRGLPADLDHRRADIGRDIRPVLAPAARCRRRSLPPSDGFEHRPDRGQRPEAGVSAVLHAVPVPE